VDCVNTEPWGDVKALQRLFTALGNRRVVINLLPVKLFYEMFTIGGSMQYSY
jgi:hypothetical protein